MKKQNTKLIFFAIILVILIAVAVKYSGQFSVLGEEGYNPYDTLLSAGTYDKAKWDYVNLTPCVPVVGYASSGQIAQLCGAPAALYDGVSVKNNSIIISPLVGAYAVNPMSGPYLRTKNLRLKNFKTEWQLTAGRCNSNQRTVGATRISTNRGVIYETPQGYSAPTSLSVGIELIWDDYSLGHYQIKANGLLVQEGTVNESEEVYFQIEPMSPSRNYGECTATGAFSNPRTKEVFGCDPKDGEYLVSKTFTENQDFSIASLRGFKKFCVDNAAIHYDNGVISSSKQVYYALGAGQTVVVPKGHIYKIFYIADGSQLGLAVQKCSGGAFDFSNNKCVGLSGLADICSSGQTIINGVCSVEAINEIDLNESVTVQGADTLLWTANYNLRTLNSGASNVLFTASPPVYTCQGTDNHQERDHYYYPQPNEYCYTFKVNDKTMKEKSTQSIDEFFDITMNSASAIIIYNKDRGLYGELNSAKSWQAQYMIKLKKPIFENTITNTQQIYALNSDSVATLNINNKYSQKLSVRLLLESKNTLGQINLKTQDIVVSPGQNTFNIPIDTSTIGDTTQKVSALVNINNQMLLSSEATTITYKVGQTTQTPTQTTTVHWWTKLWTSIKNLFKV